MSHGNPLIQPLRAHFNLIYNPGVVSSTLITTRPYPPPPRLACPQCRGPLLYRETAISGAADKGPERWDRFSCRGCGEFEYRHRTKRLRPVVS